MPEYYVSMIKEYLELQGYIVKTETKYRKERGWGDIDILAVKIQDTEVVKLIVGEVKSNSLSEKGLREANEEKFENEYVKKKLKELFGETPYEKCLYSWGWYEQVARTATELGITPVYFSEITDFMKNVIDKRSGWFYLNDYPNLMLLQFLDDRGYIKEKTKP